MLMYKRGDMRRKLSRRRKRSMKMTRRQRGGGAPTEDLGFIVPRCVKKPQHNVLFKECYNAIRKYHPTVKIVFIDDNSDKAVLEDYPMTNVEVIASEYPGAGEYLPFYYLLKRKLFKKAVLMQDSMILNTEIPFEMTDPYKFLFYYNAHESGSDPTPLLEKTKIPNELLALHTDGKWKGCWGSSMIITYDFLKKIEDKIGILEWKDMINNREMRIKLESAIALACIHLKNDTPVETNTVGGYCYDLQVMKEYNLLGKTFDVTAYSQDKDKITDKIIKVFNAR